MATNIFKKFVLMFVILQALDIILTFYGLKMGLTEQNPIAYKIINYGWEYVILIKIIISLFAVYIINRFSKSKYIINPIHKFIPLIVINIIMFITLINNIWWCNSCL